MDEIVGRISSRLGLTTSETTDMIAQTLADPDYQQRLVEVLGYEMMDEIEEICANQSHFIAQEPLDKGSYIEYCFPESIPMQIDRSLLVPTDAVGEDRKHFDYEVFNGVQSKVFEAAYRSCGNMLVCAPTSSGKTDVALLCVLRALARGSKVAYIVPMRALATEIVSKYKKKLGEHRVVEYTGDTETRAEDVARCDVVVSTPEKFDVATRKQHNLFRSEIGLVVIDEIHLLQDERGPVVEAIVCRILRYVELRQTPIRIVGLSATLPNYEDVGRFLRAEHVFSFDQGYRPVPLKMSVVGMTRKGKGMSEDDFLKKKVEEYLGDGRQVLVFVHSRGGTTRVAKLIAEDCPRRDAKGGVATGPLLELVRRGVGIHHAGLPRKVRLHMEDEFKRGHIRVLVTTSTLAWGVNLPAYAVVIKGTRFYDSSRGGFADMGILDVLQIFGRAGRPQFGSKGEACLITTGDKVDHYVSLLKNSVDVESRLLRHVADAMNAEVYLDTIEDLATAIEWLKSTFMYVRMAKNPMCYGLSREDLLDEDKALSDYVVLTCGRLEEAGMIRIHRQRVGDVRTWRFCSTEYGRVASMYYLSHETMEKWIRMVDDVDDEDSILRICFESEELSELRCREEDEEAIKDLCDEMGIEYSVCVECKLMALVKAHIRRHAVARFSLACDTEYVVKNLRRILMGLCQVLMFQSRHLVVSRCCMLLKKVERQRARPWDRSIKVAVSLSRLLGMVRMRISVESAGDHWVFVRDGGSVIYSGLFWQNVDTFIRTDSDALRVEVVAGDVWMGVEKEYCVTRDPGVRALYYDGIHECTRPWSIVGKKSGCVHFDVIETPADLYRMVDEWGGGLGDGEDGECGQLVLTSRKVEHLDKIRREKGAWINLCYRGELSHVPGISVSYIRPEGLPRSRPHILCNFSLSIRFVRVDCKLFRERLRSMNSCILSMDDYGDKAVVVVTPDAADMRSTAQDLNTRMFLRGLSRGARCCPRVRCGVPSGKARGVFVTTFDKAIDAEGDFVVVLKGCRDSGGYFPVFEVLKMCDSRETFIYEGRDYIEYLGTCVLGTRIAD